ncbi:MAG: PH domain-containing protein [Candidatus Kerfeldbacteria bacterium]
MGKKDRAQFDPTHVMKSTAARPIRTSRQKLQRHPAEHKPLHFPTQRPNEHVVLLLRRHWTILARDILQLVLSLVLPPVILAILYFYTSIRVESGGALYVLAVELFSLYYLFSFLAFFHDFVDYHLDIWVVTDQRVVSIEQVGLFNRVVSELNISRVQDVTSEIKGKVQTFLDYGQVHIQTAGEEARFVFEQVPHPSEVAKVILQVHDRILKKNELERVRQQEAYRHQAQMGYSQADAQMNVGAGVVPPQQQQPAPMHQRPAPAQVRRVEPLPQQQPQQFPSGPQPIPPRDPNRPTLPPSAPPSA